MRELDRRTYHHWLPMSYCGDEVVEIVKNVTDYQLSVVVGGVIVHYNFDFGKTYPLLQRQASIDTSKYIKAYLSIRVIMCNYS